MVHVNAKKPVTLKDPHRRSRFRNFEDACRIVVSIPADLVEVADRDYSVSDSCERAVPRSRLRCLSSLDPMDAVAGKE